MNSEQCCTNRESESIEYKWTINNIMSYLMEAQSYTPPKVIVMSSRFNFGIDAEWRLGLKYFARIIPDNTNNTFIRQVGFEVDLVRKCKTQDKKLRKLVFITCILMKNDGRIHATMHKIKQCLVPIDCIDCSKFLTNNELINEIGITEANDKLVIICKMKLFGSSKTTHINYLSPPSVNKPELCNFIDFFNDKRFTDVTFIFDDKTIEAHKMILAARSPVFNAMYSHQMKEQNSNQIYIDDISVEIFETMVRYIYSLDPPNFKNISVMDMLYAADKYALEELKEMCAKLIWRRITLNSAAETFVLADRHNLKQLFELTCNFMRKNIMNVINTSGYKIMEQEHPKLAIFIYRHATLKRKHEEIKSDEEENL